MLVADMMSPDGRVFLKSEWGLINDNWPALSFGRKSVGEKLRTEFQPGRDVLMYVGTSANHTRDPAHRSAVLSAIVVQPEHMIDTSRAIPADVWARSAAKHGDNRWRYSFAITEAANVQGPPYPLARKIIPEAYGTMGKGSNRGSVVQATNYERAAIMGLPATRVSLTQTPDVSAYLELQANSTGGAALDLNGEISRLTNLILGRVKIGGQRQLTVNPFRGAPSGTLLRALLASKWDKQRGLCALCSAPIQVGERNRMLQASADRILSSNSSYSETNVQLTHLACNLAKNNCSVEDFGEWAFAIRAVSAAKR